MKIIVVFALLGVCLATPVPQNWPYGNSPYYYGYPGKTQYVYRASIEDDEEPIARQDAGQSVTSLINNAALKQQEQINNFGNEKQQSVVETGSVAPVQDRPVDASAVANNKDKTKVSTNAAQPLNVVKPGVVNPPPFPPKRVPKPTATKKPDEDDSDEEDEDEEDEDVSVQDEEEEDDQEDDQEEEEEEARRRNEPIDVSDDAVVLPVPENATSIESVEVTPVPSSTDKPAKPVVETDKDNAVVDTPVEEEASSDENTKYEGVEAFVPGYVTDQGEVLVPVDTVTGDQPISIVPDPYTPPARGIPVNYFNYRAGLQNAAAAAAPSRFYRQGDIDDDDDSAAADAEDEPVEDEEDEEAPGGGPYEGPFEDDSEEEEEEDDADSKKKQKKKVQRPPLAFIPATAPTNEDDELESALRYRAESFPPSRSPVLLPVTFSINGGYLTGPFQRPVASAEVFQYVTPEVKYAIQRRTQTPRPNIFSPYMGQNNFDQQFTFTKPAMSPVTYVYRPAASPASNRPKTTPFYVRTQPSQSMSMGYNPSMYYAQAQQQMPIHPIYSQPTTKLHNPGEKLKIKSSYELSVEPSKESVSYKTKSRPSKKRVSSKKRPVVKTGASSPVRVVPVKKPSGSVVLKRPIYGIQGQRVQIRPANPYYVGNVKPFYTGGSHRYPGAPGPAFVPFRPYRQPTPVIYQDEPASDDSSAASDEPMVPAPGPEGRHRKWKREMKKPMAAKKVTSNKKPVKADRLGLFVPKPMKTTKTSRRSSMA